MDKGVQRGAANAQGSAEAGQEMSSQARRMEGFVQELVVLVNGKNGRQDSNPVPDNAAHSPGTRSKEPASIVSYHMASTGKSRTLGRYTGEDNSPVPRRDAKEVRPDHVIPFDEDDLEDF